MTRLCTCSGSLVSSLESSRKRNQSAEASCKTCGGRFLVDGIGPISGSMLRTVGLEVTNSINSELSWTVTKGKRSRKPVARSLNGFSKLGYTSPKRVGDFSGSDSDKFGENVIGHCFPEQVEYVPLKKRRHLLLSPSPPRASLHSVESMPSQLRTPSSHSKDLQHLSDLCGSSGQQSSGSYSNKCELVEAGVSNSLDDAVLVDKVSGITCGELYDSDDFSGIALLAATACINHVDDETDSVKGNVMEVSSILPSNNTSNSAAPLGESISYSESESLFQKDESLLEHKKSSVMYNSVVAPYHSDEHEEVIAVTSASSKVDRRHWDLNTVMEAWEEPCDGSSLGNTSRAEASVDDGMQIIDKLDREGCATRSDSGNGSDNHVRLDQIDKTIESLNLKREENKPEEFSCFDGSCILEANDSNHDRHSLEALSFPHGDTKSPRQVISNSESLDKLPLDETYHGSGISISSGNMNAASELLEDSSNIMLSTLVETTEKNVSLPEVPVLEKSVCQNDAQSKDAGNCRKTFELPENRTSLREEILTDICNIPDVDVSGSTSEDRQAFSRYDSVSTSDISGGDHSVVSGDAKDQDEKVSAADTMRTDTAVHMGLGVIKDKNDDHPVSNGEAEKKSVLHDPGRGLVCDDCHKSDVSQDDQGDLDAAENVAGLQVDYDSPYEDGELRGSVLYSWEGNEIDDGHECVDYESDGRGGEDSDTGDYPGSEIVEAGSEGSQGTEKKCLSGTQAPETDSRKSGAGKSYLRRELKESTEKIETESKKGSNQGSGTTVEMPTDMVVGRKDFSVGRKHSSDRRDVFDVKGLYLGEAGLKASRGKLLSRIEGPSSLDISGRKEADYTQQSRSRNIAGPSSRFERDICPERFATRYRSSVHDHERNGGDSRLIYWDCRNRYPSSYREPADHGQTRPRSAITDSIDKFGGLKFHDHKQPTNYSSKGTQRSLVRRSPIDRDNGYGVHRRIAGISSNRSRGSSGNFAEGIGRGLRDEYNEPVVDDGVASSGRMPHYLSRRERSCSPPSRRVTHISAPCRKSRSRSRTRSPRTWQPQRQRERNIRTRRHSRSPEFRSDSRMERMRAPFQKPSFAADYGESYMSPPRSRFSPHRNYRWVDERNFVDSHLRHRRSPPQGVFRRNQRLDHVGLAGRLKSDDYLRAMTRPRRYPHFAGVDRGCKLEENCDDRRYDDRSGMIHEVRQSDTSAVLRRSRPNAENFEAGNSNNENGGRSTDRRDVPRSTKEDKRSFKV